MTSGTDEVRRRSNAIWLLLATVVAAALILSSLAWINTDHRGLGLAQIITGGVLGTAVVVYGRWPRRGRR